MERVNRWKTYTDEQLEEVEKVSSRYKSCLDAGKTERESVSLAADMAKEAGYKDLAEYVKENAELKCGDKVYVNQMGKALALFQIGEEPLERGMNILGAHVDSPRLDVKQNPLYEESELAYLDTHYYGGIKKYQWAAIPLALHGTVAKKDGTTVDITIGEKEDDPVLVISDLLIHLAGEQMEKKASEDSKNINFDTKPKVIISAAGMCDAGRIRHHLKHNLWRPESTIVFAGYQAEGTLGRTLVEGGKTVKLFGETIDVEARIVNVEGLSGHADRKGLLEWIGAFETKPDRVFMVHGEDTVCTSFAMTLNQEYGLNAEAPFSGSVFDLAANQWLTETAGVPINKAKAAQRKAIGVYGRLVAAGERLLQVIRHNEGGANKDLAKFADQIHALCDKWDR